MTHPTHTRASDLEGALEQLYQAPIGEFTRKRDALAKSLHGAGDDEAAKAVRARRKPTQMAWVLNQLSRRDPEGIAELVDVGRELAREQRKALRGEATGSFRASIDRQREVIAALTRKATRLMNELGIDPTGHLDEISSALLASLVDPAVGAGLEEGRLERTPRAASAGLGGPSLETALAASTARAVKKPVARRTARARGRTTASKDARSEAKRTLAHERREQRAAAVAAKKAAAEEQSDRLASERAAKRAVVTARATLRAAEAAAEKKRRAAEKADAEARTKMDQAKALADEAEASARAVEDARRKLVRAVANAP